jgi:GT2 family glycosyltransferase
MAVRADLWRSLGGMSTPLATNYNDVDLCLRARRSGARVACVPFRGLVHHESESRGTEPSAEIAADWLLFRSRWAGLLGSS